MLTQLGSEITSDPDVVRAILARFNMTEQNPPRDAQIVELFASLARLASEGASMCEVGALVRALSTLVRLILIFISFVRDDCNDAISLQTSTGPAL